MTALTPAITEVAKPAQIKNPHAKGELLQILNDRINKKIPAVTRVEECTNEETGVGAIIAAGSHLLNGT